MTIFERGLALTTITDLLSDGWDVKISEMVRPGEPFYSVDPGMPGFIPGKALIVFHPLDYNYAAYESPLNAHEQNLQWLNKWLDERVAKAMAKIDEMTDSFNAFYEVKQVDFFDATEVFDNGDGTFTFRAVEQDPYTRMIEENKKAFEDEMFRTQLEMFTKPAYLSEPQVVHIQKEKDE